MTGLEAYKLFTALNNHFTQNRYDYFKYNGQINIKSETFEKHRNRGRYESLAHKLTNLTSSKEERENFIVANLIEAKGRAWIGTLAMGDADDIYLRWQGRVQALAYNISNEIKLLLENQTSFNDLFKCVEHEHPEILKAYLRGDISLESFVVLDICLDFIPRMSEKLGDDRNWMLAKMKTIKYRPFVKRLNIDVAGLSKTIQQAVREMMGVTN
jgi:hypothetical protein